MAIEMPSETEMVPNRHRGRTGAELDPCPVATTGRPGPNGRWLTKMSSAQKFAAAADDISTSPIDAARAASWGVPVTIVSGSPAKTAVLLDRSSRRMQQPPASVALYTDSAGIRTDWGSPADTWTKNQVVARTEGRFDLAVFLPNAVAKIGTAA